MKLVNYIMLLFIASIISSCDSTPSKVSSPPAIPVPTNVSSSATVPVDNEIVMSDGMKIVATTDIGTIEVTATKGLERAYIWEGETRSVIMWPRKKRWFGSMGIYYPGPGNHWKEHNGISRGVLEEGHRHFDNVENALKWLKMWSECHYRDDGLVVCYAKRPDRKQLNVEVWQIYLGGTVPSKFQESAFETIGNMNWPEDVKEAYRSKCYVDGHKPTNLPGSQNEMIKVSYRSEINETKSN